jgi:ribonuclease HII
MRSTKFLRAEQTHLSWDPQGLWAGVDEAGRGPWAGPVVAAAVILDDLNSISGLADSKKLSTQQRSLLFDEICAKSLCCAVGVASVEEIDRHNILQATMMAMRRAVEGLRLKPVKVLVDGLHIPPIGILAESVVKGDAKIPAISAASILAKVHRDFWCAQVHQQYPHYGFDRHKGYGTAEHLEALKRYGPCELHRKSFTPVRQQLEAARA